MVYQFFRHIYRSEGLRALWKGVGATVVGVMPSRAIYFSAYQTFKSNLSQNIFDGRENVYVHLGAAVTAGKHTVPLFFYQFLLYRNCHGHGYKSNLAHKNEDPATIKPCPVQEFI